MSNESKQSSPIGGVEQAAKWKELVEDSKVSYAYLFAGSRLTIEDWHKIYDNAFFLFTEWLAGSQWVFPLWVKASERLPKEYGKVHWRWANDRLPATVGNAYYAIKEDEGYTIEWLDETPAHPTAEK